MTSIDTSGPALRTEYAVKVAFWPSSDPLASVELERSSNSSTGPFRTAARFTPNAIVEPFTVYTDFLPNTTSRFYYRGRTMRKGHDPSTYAETVSARPARLQPGGANMTRQIFRPEVVQVDYAAFTHGLSSQVTTTGDVLEPVSTFGAKTIRATLPVPPGAVALTGISFRGNVGSTGSTATCEIRIGAYVTADGVIIPGSLRDVALIGSGATGFQVSNSTIARLDFGSSEVIHARALFGSSNSPVGQISWGRFTFEVSESIQGTWR